MLRILAGALAAVVLGWGWGCSDPGGPTESGAVPGALGAAIRCEASPGQGTLVCSTRPGGGGGGGTGAAAQPSAGSEVTLGGQGELVRVVASDVGYDAGAGVFRASVTVQNLLALLLGTPDGFALTGLRVFHHSGPTATAGSGTVRVLNADGAATFTLSGQPYFQYAQVLEPGEVSSPRVWEWSVPPTVQAFAFEVFVRSHAGVAVTAPTTGFEDRSGAGWTTHEEELGFLAAVAAASPRLTLTVIGESQQARPLHLVRVGYPAAPADAAVAEGRSVLVIGSQHGNEPAGREMALELLRDLAFTLDPVLVQQLAGTALLFIPSANPDGRAANTRTNSVGIDPNRDHMRLVTPEGRAMARVLRDFTPDVVIDAHERPGASVQDMQLLWPRNLNVYDPVRELSREMVLGHVWPDLVAGGYSVGLYGPNPGSPGDENEAILRNAAGLRHGLSMLTETAGQQAPSYRVGAHLAAVHAVLRFHRERVQDVAAAVSAAPGQKAAAGAARSQPFFLFGADNEAPSAGQVLDPPPCGYLLDAVQAEAIGRQIELFPLRTQPVGAASVFVTMSQPLMTVVPLLLDARARANLVEGLALQGPDSCADPGSVTGAYRSSTSRTRRERSVGPNGFSM